MDSWAAVDLFGVKCLGHSLGRLPGQEGRHHDGATRARKTTCGSNRGRFVLEAVDLSVFPKRQWARIIVS